MRGVPETDRSPPRTGRDVPETDRSPPRTGRVTRVALKKISTEVYGRSSTMTRKKAKNSPAAKNPPGPVPTSQAQQVITSLSDNPRGSNVQVRFVPIVPTTTGANRPASVRTGSSSITSSRAAARASLALQLLEEEKRLEKEYLTRKYEILLAQAEERGGSVVSRRSSLQRTSDWVDSLQIPTTSTNTGPAQLPLGTLSRTGTIAKETRIQTAVSSTVVSAANVQQPVMTSATSATQIVISTQAAASSTVVQRPVTSSKTSANLLEEACGGENIISSIDSGFAAIAGSTISPSDTAEELVRELSALQLRMDNLQRQLKSDRPPVRTAPSRDAQRSQSSSLTSGKAPSGKLWRIPEYEFPPATTNARISAVSQSCTNTTTTATTQINASGLSMFISPPPRSTAPHIVSTSPASVGPCIAPPSMSFTPSYMSTPNTHLNTTVCTVSACHSPIISPMIPASASTSAAVSTPVPVPPPPPRQLFPGPTPQQLAARHVVPKDLPKFSGEPVDWPLFLSSYENSTDLCGYSDGENLSRLQRCLVGNAREEVDGDLMHPTSVPVIIETLKMRFGRPELIIHSLLDRVRAIQPPSPEDLKALARYALACRNLCKHLEAAGLEAYSSNPTLLMDLVNKLPANIKLQWSLHQSQLLRVDLNSFGHFMGQIANAACNVTFTTDSAEPRSSKTQKPPKSKEKLFVNAHAASEPEQKDSSSSISKENPVRPCQICQKVGHKAKDCHTFRKMSLEDRWKAAYDHHLCRRCLISHGRYPCRASECGENGCKDRHHKLLHPGNPKPTSTANAVATTTTVIVHHHLQQTVLFRVVPVSLHGNGKVVHTFAFLDNGSSTTLVELKVAKELGLTGKTHPLCLQWTNGIERIEDQSQMIKLKISGKDNAKRHLLERAHTVDNLNLPVQSLDYQQLSEQFPYLRDLPIDSYTSAVPTILIGLDNLRLQLTLDYREGEGNRAVATETRLGWMVYGPMSSDALTEHRQFHIHARSLDQELHDLVKEFFALERVGTTTPVTESDEDLRARGILEQTTTRTSSGRFQSGLLWKYDSIEFPDSRFMAEKRLKCLERRLAANPELYERVRMLMKEYQDKEYAQKVSSADFSSFDPKRIWYLPVNIVTNPRKPNKVRLVWDAAAKVQGQSLNTNLLAGPDLLTPLPAVLCPFRQFKVAITGDIEQMFHRVLIRPEDRSALLFLWRDDPSMPIEVLMMNVAPFGSTCSPSIAQFVKNRNAEEYAAQFPRAAEAIIKHHYVDDFLYSVDTEEEAIELAQQVKTVHSRAGFHIRNWLSNSPNVLLRVGEKQVEPTKCFAVDKESKCERVLGMIWKPDSDVLVFQGLFRDEILILLQGTFAPSKRQVLRVVMSMFDPPGLVAVFVVHGKVLIQNIWRAGINWDECIADKLLEQWTRWIKLLKELDKVEIPRCYFPGYSPEALRSLELHIFVDASEEAYAAVAYFRIVEGDRVRCALVAAKTKVAPLKLLSIPRLELQAAVLGARLVKFVVANHTLNIPRVVLWSDSKTCLAWLRSDQRKYRQFVAFRVSEILELTRVEDWRWVPTHENVADEATKWGKGPNVNSSSRWFNAPAFLYQSPDTWPQEVVTETTEELRPLHVHHHLVKQQLVEFNRFSKWERLVRAVTWVHRYIGNLLQRSKNQTPETSKWLNKAELLKGEATVCRLIQHETFGDEIVVLTRNQQLAADKHQRLEKTSKIAKLSPFLDEHGVIRMDSRLSSAPDFEYDFKYPVILPKKHYGTYLLLDHYHREHKHHNSETALNEVRQRFHVSQMRVEYRQATKRCQWCKVYKAKPEIPRMAPLPVVRTTANIRPFTFVGVDYFGPLLIRQGRSEVKCWVALFTCLSIRAVHLEPVQSLSTESCKMAIRRFIAIRGAPAEIYSDRGTNFVGANRDLKRELQRIHEDLASTFTNGHTQWRFNPPSAPHMGGSWERMVRSVKCALKSLTTVRKPNDETLRTLLAEAASMVNSRPLTYMPLNPDTQEALTPNCFLMLSTSGVNQPARRLDEARRMATCNWDLCQELLDQFWKRWIKEYLPTITKRTKWFVDCRPVQIDDLVVVVEDGVRNGWLRGQVIKFPPGQDGRVRSATVRTSSGAIIDRPVANLAVLDVDGTAEAYSKQYGSGDVPETDRSPPRTGRVTRAALKKV